MYRQESSQADYIYFKCKEALCYGRVSFFYGGVFRGTHKEHVCVRNSVASLVFMLVSKAKNVIHRFSTGTAFVDHLYVTCTADMLMYLPSKAALLMQYFRLKAKHQPKIPTDINFIIPDCFSYIGNEKFILKDILLNDGDRILIFGTGLNLSKLCKNRNIFVDGTFSVVPQHFLQLYTFHTLVCGKLVLRLACLLTSKSKQLYVALIRAIRDLAAEALMVFNPVSVIVAINSTLYTTKVDT